MSGSSYVRVAFYFGGEFCLGSLWPLCGEWTKLWGCKGGSGEALPLFFQVRDYNRLDLGAWCSQRRWRAGRQLKRDGEGTSDGLLDLTEGEGAHGEKLALRPLSGWSHHSSQEEARAQIRSFGLKLARC